MFVKGKDFNCFIQDAGQWKLIFCSQSCTLVINTQTLPSTTKGDGRFSRSIPARLSWSVSTNGLIKLDTPFSSSSLAQLQLSLNGIRLRFVQDDQAGNQTIYEGDAIILSTEYTGEYSSISTWSAEFEGTGKLETSAGGGGGTSNIYSHQYDAEGGEVIISIPELLGAEIISVGRGLDLAVRNYPEPFGTGEVQFRSATGTLEFGTELMPEEVVTIIYKA